jgi:guanylate kinase
MSLKIKKLLIISAPSRAGKTTLMNAIKKDKFRFIFNEMGVNENKNYTIPASKIKELRGEIESIVIHYDMASNYRRNKNFNHINKLMIASEEIKILTIEVEPSLLIERLNETIKEILKRFSEPYDDCEKTSLLLQARISLLKKYKEKNFIEKMYKNWYLSLAEYGVTKHWKIRTEHLNHELYASKKGLGLGFVTLVESLGIDKT